MVRGKRQMKRIENPVHQQVSFCKRRGGLLKKAKELSILCDADIGIIIFSKHGKLYELATKGTMQGNEGMIEKYKETRCAAEAKEEAHKSLELKQEVDVLKQEIQMLQMGFRYTFGSRSEKETLDELHGMERYLENRIRLVRTEKMKNMSQEIQQLKNKEEMLEAANEFLQGKALEQNLIFNMPPAAAGNGAFDGTPVLTGLPSPLIIQNEINRGRCKAELLGLPLIPAHSEATGEGAFHGLNYASAAAGILDVTGRNFVGRIPFNQQIRNFENTVAQITNQLGADGVAEAIAKCIFFVGMGSNDYLNNYMMPNYNTRNRYNPQQYADLLVQQYTTQLTRLYNLGAKKFVIAGVGSLACIPSILAQSANGSCSPALDNSLVIPFNNNVKAMLNRLNVNLPGAKFIYVNIFQMFMDILHNPGNDGFSVVDRGCCGIGRNSGQITCLPLQTPCSNRNQYVFWDAFHPTAAVNVIMGRRAFSGGSNVVQPMNIEQLANLDIE